MKSWKRHDEIRTGNHCGRVAGLHYQHGIDFPLLPHLKRFAETGNL